MTQQVYVGTNAAPQSGLYGGTSPVEFESGATASNGFGVRMTASRVYTNWFTAPFSTGSTELTQFNEGKLIVISVSNFMKSGVDLQTHDGHTVSSVTHKKIAAGNYDTAISAMFTRIAGLGFSTTATDSYGGLTQPNIRFIYEHEMDAAGVDGGKGNYYYSNGWVLNGTSNGTKDTATDYINAITHVHSLWVNAANTAGVPTSRCLFNFCMTSYGYAVKRVDQYWPGNTVISELGSDPYISDGAGGGGSDNITDVSAYAIKWNMPVGYPEFNAAGADSSSRASAFTTAFNTLANETRYTNTFVCIWDAPDSNSKYNFNKSSAQSAGGHAFPLTHAAIASGITTLGGNPIISAAGQGLPTNPTLTGCTSNSAGTQITLTWANPPAGDNITGWDVYLAAGTTTTYAHINSTTLAAATRSYTFTALANGTAIAPGTAYSCDVVAINSAGRSGYGTPATTGQITTQQPGGTSQAPVITAQTAVVDATNPQQIDITVTATSPGGFSLTYSHKITGPNGFTETLAGSAVNVTGSAGAYLDTFTVTDNASPANVTTGTIPFTIAATSTSTPNVGLVLIAPGTRYADSVPIHRANSTAQDTVFGQLLKRQSSHNAKYDLSGANFSPDALTGSTTVQIGAGQTYWVAFTLEDTQLSQLLFISLTTAQTGTGVKVSVHDASGAMLPDFNGTPASGTAVDTAFQATPGPLVVPLGLTVTHRTFGETLFAQIAIPSTGVTAAALRVSSVPGAAAKIGAGATTPLWGYATSAWADPIPFSGWVSQNQIWVGCQ